jgi:hypothetical protein
MKLVKTLFGVLFASALFTVQAIGSTNAVATSSDHSDLWNATVGGGATVQTTGTSDAMAGLNFSLAHKARVVIPSEVGVRQSIGWSNTTDKNVGTWQFNTKLFNDWNLFRIGSVQLLAGGNGGVSYGNRPVAWTVAPEIEGRLWLKKDVYTGVRAEYDFDVSNTGIKAQNSLGVTAFLGFSF